jgi:hypothetical protein
MRLHPVVTKTMKRLVVAENELVLPDGTRLPKGSRTALWC